MELTVKSKKILNYIYNHRNSGVSRKKLIKKFHCSYLHNEIDKLTPLGYISHDYVFPRDPSGFPIGNIPDTALYFINEPGICEVERNRWFDTKYVITSLIVPVVIGVVSSLITALLLLLIA